VPVSAIPTVVPAEPELLNAARSGDGVAFQRLVAPHLRALHVHCYRMLGSYHDAEEALQETLLRAWRALDGYEGRAPLLHWLYRIATTTCLKALAGRARLPATVDEVDHLRRTRIGCSTSCPPRPTRPRRPNGASRCRWRS